MNALTPSGPLLLRPSPEEDDLSRWLDELVSLLRRRGVLIAACLALALFAAAAYVLGADPGYTAEATLLIDDRRPDVFRQAATLSDAQTLNALVESEVEVLRSLGLARGVVASLGLAADPEFNRPPGLRARLLSSLRARLLPPDRAAAGPDAAAERAAQQLLAMTVVRRVGLTYVIQLDVTATTPGEAARLARGLTDAYLAEQLVARGSSTHETADWLRQRLEALRLQALDADGAVQAFQAKSGIVQTGQGRLDQQQLAELQTQLVAARSRTAQAKARLDAVRAVLSRPGLAEDAVPEELQSPVITGLRQKYFEDARLESEWSSRYGRSHAAAVNLRRDMAEIEGSIRREVGRIAEAAGNEDSVAAASEAAIKAQLDALVGQSETTDASHATLRSLESSAEVYRALYSSFLQRYAQSTEEESFPVVSARIVTPAQPPLTRSQPRTGLLLAAAALLGLVVGFALALALELLDRGLRTPAQLERELGLPCIALLPRRRPAPTRAPTRAATRAATSRFAREIRRLRLRTLQHLGNARGGVVAVLPARSGDGASTVAQSLAAALEEAGHRTALVRPASLGPVPEPAPGDPAVRTRTAADLRALLDELRPAHDFLVLDLPALDGLDAAEIALQAADCLVVVARCGTTRGQDIARVIDGYGLDWRRIAGVVLNRAGREGRREARARP